MDILSIAAQLILSLSLLVVLHECGHFFPAKWFKTRVEKFYLFFNPGFSLFKKQIGETEYGIGWVPFGGYVKISGMIDESMDKEQMQGEPQPWEFRSKKAWQRLIIMIGGVTVNFILGILIFAGIYWYFGETYLKSKELKYGVAVSELGKELGLRDGDKVIGIGDLRLEKHSPGRVKQDLIIENPKTLTVERAGAEIQLPVPDGMAKLLTKRENKDVKLFEARFPQKVVDIRDGSPAKEAGIEIGDRIISVDGKSTPYFHNFKNEIAGKSDTTMSIVLIRAGRDTLQKSLELDKKGKLGIDNGLAPTFFPVYKQKYGFWESIPMGAKKSVNFLGGQLKAFKKMFSGEIKATDSLGSVFSIANMFDPEWDWEQFWFITGMLSILLAFFNLLPIPALDGGYVMFLIWEVITGKKPSDKVMEYATLVGFVLLIGLMIFALGNDVRNIILE